MTQAMTRWQYSEPLNPANPVQQITREFRARFLHNADQAARQQAHELRRT